MGLRLANLCHTLASEDQLYGLRGELGPVLYHTGAFAGHRHVMCELSHVCRSSKPPALSSEIASS